MPLFAGLISQVPPENLTPLIARYRTGDKDRRYELIAMMFAMISLFLRQPTPFSTFYATRCQPKERHAARCLRRCRSRRYAMLFAMRRASAVAADALAATSAARVSAERRRECCDA